MEKAMGTMIVALAIGALLGFGGGYYYMESQVDEAFTEGMEYQSEQTTPQSYTQPSDLELDWDIDTFDHAGTVDVDGNVASDTDIDHTITIVNDGDTDASNLWIMLEDPTTGSYGLEDELETENTEVTLSFGGLSGIALFEDETYTDGYEIGDIPAGASIELDITFTMLENDDEDYEDGKTYDDCEIFIYEPGANNVESLEFTVNT